jgi:uncharacterized protein
MNKQVLEEMTRQYLGFNFPETYFNWQGGEPTLCGLPFFEKAVELQMKYSGSGQKVNNTLQTNGLLVNKDWCSFFNRYKFLIGLSLDGPREIHDYYRTTNSHGSWETVMRTAKMMKDYAVEFNILTVLTRRNGNHARSLFYWFVEQGFHYLQFIPCLEILPDGGIAPFSITPKSYGDFLCELFDAWWEKHTQNISIQIFDAILVSLIHGKPTLCSSASTCKSYLVIEYDGSVYPCDFFVRKETCIGNLKEVNLVELFCSETYQNFGKKKYNLDDDCRQCTWLSFCHGGCPKDWIDAHGQPVGKTYFCSAYQQFFKHAMPRLRRLADVIYSK